MRRFLIFTIAPAILLSSCIFSFRDKMAAESFSAESPGDKKLHALYGEWLCTRSEVFMQDKKTELELEEVLKDAREAMELNVLKFTGSKLFVSEMGHTYKIDSTEWQFVPNNIIHVSGNRNNEWAYMINYLDKDSMILTLLLPAPEQKEVGKINCRFAKINTKKIANTDLFDTSINKWRGQAKKPESNAELADRVRGILKYNYVYIRSLYYSSASFINTRKFNLPFLYYNGGIGLKKELDSRDNFVDFFYTREDAYKAFDILRKAFPKVQYEKESNYILEYATFMKKLADAI